jgi:regulator of RNase E activity RraB
VESIEIPITLLIRLHCNVIDEKRRVMVMNALVEKFSDDQDLIGTRFEPADVELAVDDDDSDIE